jgi:NitT/TauT family transport system substrate-binding protein
MRRFLFAAILGALFLTASGSGVWGKSHASPGVLYTPRGPSLFPVISLRQQMIHGPRIVFWNTPEEITALLLSGEAECALLPVTLGAAIHQRGLPMVLLGVIQWDLFSLLVPSGESFASLKDLGEGPLYLPFGRGTTADVLVRSSLRKAGIVPDVSLRLLYAPPQEIAALLGAGKARYAVLPEPFASLALSKARVERGLPLRRLWQDEAGERLHLPVTGLFVSRRSFDAKPDFFRDLERQYLLSLKWGESHFAQAVDFLRQDFPFPREILEAALRECDFTYRPGSSVCKELRIFYEYLCERAPESCGGVPEKDFFYP